MPIDHFGLIASFYDRVGGFTITGPLLGLLNLSPNDSLLDAGGGTGRVAAALRDMVREVFVLDISQGMLRRAMGKGLATVCAPAEKLPLQSDSIDRIIMVDAFHHVSDQSQVVKELKRILAPAGRILIIEPNIRKLWVKLIAFGEKLLLMRSHFRTAEEINSLLSSPELKVTMTFDEFNILLVAEKLM